MLPALINKICQVASKVFFTEIFHVGLRLVREKLVSYVNHVRYKSINFVSVEKSLAFSIKLASLQSSYASFRSHPKSL